MITPGENIKGLNELGFNEHDDLQAEPEKIFSRDVKCPYCQEIFNTEDVLFRAEETYTDGDIAGVEKRIFDCETGKLTGSLNEQTADEQIRELKKELEILKKFKAVTDEIMVRHWTNRENGWPRDTANLREFEWGYSEIKDNEGNEITGTPVGQVKCCLLENDEIVKIRDESGFLEGAEDERGVRTEKRVCPHCHCVLPNDYGRDEVHFIACAGVRGSGKTVFLSKFLEEAHDMINRSVGFTVLLSDNARRFIENKKVEKGTQLPEATDTETIKPPIDIRLFNPEKQKFYTFVFYDIAGENCTSAEAVERKGVFIKDADAIIMLIAPGQIEEIKLHSEDAAEAERSKDTDVNTVFFALANAYGADQVRNKKCATNLAVVLSKSDVYKHASKNGKPLNDDIGNMFKEIEYENGFMTEQHLNVRGDILSLLKGTTLRRTIENWYKKVDYFAVSTLGSRPTMIDEKNKNGCAPDTAPIRLEEPFVWVLNKLGIVDSVYETSLAERVIAYLKGLIKWK